jgi:hypothetical protein
VLQEILTADVAQDIGFPLAVPVPHVWISGQGTSRRQCCPRLFRMEPVTKAPQALPHATLDLRVN